MWLAKLLIPGIFLAALPTTPTYQLRSYGFGSGGAANSSTPTYSLEGISGEISGNNSTTPTYGVNSGFTQTEQANVPQVQSLDNNSGLYYNKLHFVIDTQNNPTDATYAIQVSTTSNFSSNNFYLQADGTLGATAVYQDYATWGGAGGGYIIGLTPSTTYYVHIKATQGKFTESAFGPSASQATSSPSLTFSLNTSNQGSPPFSINIGNLVPGGSAVVSPQTINLAVTTNAASGADVYIISALAKLQSASNGSVVNSATADLSSAPYGYGARSQSITQGSLGTLSVTGNFGGSGNNVGGLTTTYQSIYTASSPVTGPSAKVELQARAASTNLAATDYGDTLTLVASGNF